MYLELAKYETKVIPELDRSSVLYIVYSILSGKITYRAWTVTRLFALDTLNSLLVIVF